LDPDPDPDQINTDPKPWLCRKHNLPHLDEVVTVLELSLLREEQGIVRQVGGGGGGQRAGGQVGKAARGRALVVLLEDGAEQLPLPQPVVVLGVRVGSSPALFL